MTKHVFVLSLFALVVAGCGGRAGAWNGTWWTTYGEMALHQAGRHVTGRYQGGCDAPGTIDATVSGKRLSGTWTQTDGHGTFVFTLAPNRRSFTGLYGEGGGISPLYVPEPWGGARSRSESPEDSGCRGSARKSGPPPGLGPDVTLAYFEHGVGLVGVAPYGSGWQGYTPSTLWLTTNGTRWRNVTPPGSSQGRFHLDHPWFEDASFLDRSTGWVTTYDPATVRVVVYGTTNGGATWKVVGHGEHGEHAGAAYLVQLVNRRVAFAEHLEPTGPAMDLSVSHDGGRSWRLVYSGPPPTRPGQRPEGPFEVPMVFVSASRGFAAAGIPPYIPYPRNNRDFFGTVDGGRDWSLETPPVPARKGELTYGLPTFTDPRRGVLPSKDFAQGKVTIGFSATADGGMTWKAASRVAAGNDARVSVQSPTVWWVVARTTHRLATSTTSDSGRTWSQATAPAPGTPERLLAINRTHALLIALVAVPAGELRELYVTSDGGRSWHRRF